MIPWSLIGRLAPYAAIGLALLWGGFEHTWRVILQRDAAQEVAKAQAMVAAFKEADEANTRKIADAHAAEIARIKGEANARETSIRRAVASNSCLDTPAYRAFIGGLPVAPQADPGSQVGPRRTGTPLSR